MSRITLLSSKSHLGTEFRGEEAVRSGKGLLKNGPNSVIRMLCGQVVIDGIGEIYSPLWFTFADPLVRGRMPLLIGQPNLRNSSTSLSS